MKTYHVVIKEFGGKIIEVIGAGMSERKAEKVERGILINMDRDHYCTEIRED